MTTGHAFLSYVHEDSDAVDWLQAQLQTAGLEVWRDRDRLWGGDDWKRVLRQAIQDDALAFVACFSITAVQKQKTVQREELLFAIDEGRKLTPGARWIIPVRFDDCEISDYDLGGGRCLTDLHWVDLFGADQVHQLDRLIQDVAVLLGGAAGEAGPSRPYWDRPYIRTIRPGTTDIDEFVEFVASRQDVTVSLDLAIEAFGEVEPWSSEVDGHQILMVPNAVKGVLGPCGAEIVLHDLPSAPDSFFYFEHGRHIIRGRFLLHGVSGPHQGTMSVSLRAIPAA